MRKIPRGIAHWKLLERVTRSSKRERERWVIFGSPCLSWCARQKQGHKRAAEDVVSTIALARERDRWGTQASYPKAEPQAR